VSEVLTRVYRNGLLDAEGFPLSAVSDYIGEADTVVWVDLFQPSRDVLQELADELGLHDLAVEDAVGPAQRPKLDRYATHLFLASYFVELDQESARLDALEVDLFVNRRWLITVRKADGFPLEAVLARWARSPDLAVHGVGFLLYGLFDVIIDGYFDALAAFDQYYETVSDGLFADRPVEATRERHWFDLRQAMVRFHRLAIPMRETVSSLMRREEEVIPEELYPYFQDIYDHMLRVTESSEALRDVVGAIVETNLSLRSYRQNIIVKKVSSWAAIVAVPALITGYYGMNVPFPGSGGTWGVIISTALIVVVPVILYWLFRRYDWL
jgi:magnesium transporter